MTVRTLVVGPFVVADLDYREAVQAAAALAVEPSHAQRFYALHVGGLNARRNTNFVAEMNAAELVCADGGSVVILGKLAGARRMQRVPTTDAGWDVLKEVGSLLGRPTRIALVGARQEEVDGAARTLAEGGAGEVVLIENGYHQDWSGVLARLADARPDVLVLGLGAPKEMLWVREHLDELPACLVMTCGGWFGFLSGTETRAPELLRRPGLEWLARVSQAPGRLLPRYLQGMVSTAVLAGGVLLRRARSWRRA